MELVLIRGLPGSGKSTMAAAMEGYDHFEADQWFCRDGVYQYDGRQVKQAHAWCLAKAIHSMRRKRPCVVANTFVTRDEMAPYLKVAQKLGITTRVVEATGQWESTHQVPQIYIDRMRTRWEAV